MKGLTFYGRLGKFTWRMCALVLASQSILVFFGALVAWGIARADQTGAPTAYLVVGSLFAVGCLVAAGLMRSPIGVTLGWLVQLACFASMAIVPMMGLVGLIFGSLWVVCLVQGKRIDAAAAAREGGADTLTP